MFLLKWWCEAAPLEPGMKTKALKIAATTTTKRQTATKSGALAANDVAFKCRGKSNAFGMIAVAGFFLLL